MTAAVNARFLSQRLTGVQRAALELSRQLKKLRPDLSFISPAKILHPEAARELEVRNAGPLGGALWEQAVLPRHLVRQGTPLLLNLANTAPLYYPRQIVTLHDLAFLVHPGWFSRSFCQYYRFLIPRVARHARKIITVSEFSKREIVRLLHIPAERICVIPCGLTGIFSPLHEGATGRPSGRFGDYVLAVGSLEPRKNLDRVVAAFDKINQPGLNLVLAGAPNSVFSKSGTAVRKQSAGNVHCTGYVSDADLADLYRNAQCLVYPSLYEGFGLPPLEAMGCGCPVVVSRAASLPEVCGDAVCYVDPESTEDIARGLREVLLENSLRKNLIEKGYERARKFNWERSAAATLRALDEAGASG